MTFTFIPADDDNDMVVPLSKDKNDFDDDMSSICSMGYTQTSSSTVTDQEEEEEEEEEEVVDTSLVDDELCYNNYRSTKMPPKVRSKSHTTTPKNKTNFQASSNTLALEAEEEGDKVLFEDDEDFYNNYRDQPQTRASCPTPRTARSHLDVRPSTAASKPGTLLRSSTADSRMSCMSASTRSSTCRRGSVSAFFARSLAASSRNHHVSTNNDHSICLMDDAEDSEANDALHQLLQDEIDILEQDQNLDRDRIRLESFEAYVLVSVMTASASYGSFQSSSEAIDACTSYTMMAVLYGKMTCSAISALCGLYATMVFSLCVLYGKTALGMKKDDMFEHFVQQTGKQRFRGFQAFAYSLRCFAAEVAFSVVAIMGLPGLVAVGFVVMVIFDDLQGIIQAAGPIFTGIIPTTLVGGGGSSDSEDYDDSESAKKKN